MAFYNPNDPQSLEKYSSATTLSDMEAFIFPETVYALVLANIMSPRPWIWRKNGWFDKMDRMNPYRKVLRLKQYIMDHFAFNLDLDTWGLTTKQKELARFAPFIDEATLAQSNALFGYEGDKYYFDIDIRKHFGLDKYTSDVIPYWKTETIEAMESFRYKEGYPSGAGECVSLSTLYAAALFVLAGIPLDKMFLMATPLHSQNFVDVGDGIITNNRRIVTKSMWFNGTEISAKAQRALLNERVTIVLNNTGYIHVVYNQATIDKNAYADFGRKLSAYLRTDITFEILANFLRARPRLQHCFQFCHSCYGKPRYIEAEKVYHYEHNYKFKASDNTRQQLLDEIDEDEFYTTPVPNRIILDELEDFFKANPVSIEKPCDLARLKKYLQHTCFSVEEVIGDLIAFCRIEPRLPDTEKEWLPPSTIDLTPDMSREAIIERLESLRTTNPVADLAFSAYRDMRRAPWKPFLKAALERSPVSIAGAASLDMDQTAGKLLQMPDESIYDGTRLAQPDEVWNFGRGDGLEKALCLLNIWRAREPQGAIAIDGDGKIVRVTKKGGKDYVFKSSKGLVMEERVISDR
jgi:hypothetical protein